MNEFKLQSDSIDELAAALSKAQLSISAALKDSNNPFFKSKYADLTSVWSACRKELSENGLSVSQVLDGMNLVTTLMHSSGQWVRGSCPLILVKQDMQSLGSSVTYARRYSLAAICGVVQDDDDGNLATGKVFTGQKESASWTPRTEIKTQPVTTPIHKPEPINTPALDEHRLAVETKNAEFIRDGKVAILGAFYGRLIADLKEPALKSIISSFEAEYKKDKEKCSGIEYKETITRVRERLKEFEEAKSGFASFNQTSVIVPRVQ